MTGPGLLTMSIYYKAKFGYTTYTTASDVRANVKKLSDITFLDDCLLSIPIIPVVDVNETVNYPTDEEFYNYMKFLIGGQVDSLYTAPSYFSGAYVGEGLAHVYNSIPSIQKNCPNLALDAQTPTSSKISVMYIPGFKRCIFDSSGYKVFAYVSSDGTLTYPSTRSMPLRWTCYSTLSSLVSNVRYYRKQVYMFGLVKYDSPEDLLDIDNWRSVSVYTFEAPGNSSQYFNRVEVINENAFNEFWGGLTPDPPDYNIPSNPYEPVDPSGPSDGQGTFDDSSDTISDSNIPTLSSANTGFTRIYNPSLAQVQDLARYLWTDTTIIDTIWNHIRQYFEDPMQAIIGFNLVPVPVPDGGTEEFKLMFFGTGVQMTVAASQFVDVDCGTLSVPEYYGSALDYTPYTKISAFLPFIGNVDLNPDEIMGRTLQVKYRVDICSGSCVAKILIDGNVLYQYSGHCAIPIPISAADFSSYVSAAVSVAKLAIGAAVGGAMGAAAVGGTEALQATGNMQQTRIVNTERNPATGRQITSSTQTIISQRPQSTHQTEASFGGITPANITNTVGEIMGSKPFFQHSGSFSGNTGYLGVRRPYLIIIRPRLCMPSDYQKMNGYPCMMTLKLGDCSGYTRVQQVQLTGMTATNPEQSEILQLLKMGVII